MAITRQVIDKKRGIQQCRDCGGRGMRVQTIRMGPMIQQMQSPCDACEGQGKSFKMKSERELLEVHIQKGSPDGHEVRFSEMADMHPDADAGDLVFVLQQQQHPEFKRKGADLFLERKISLVEALCGFEMEVTHLDGRKLLIKSPPGEVVKPLLQGYDPLANSECKQEWEKIENSDCPDIANVARAETTDVDGLKNACETQLKKRGFDVGAFVIDESAAYFKQGTREEILAAKKTRRGCTMYVISDPQKNSSLRMMKAVKDEGMPTYRNPFVHGNLFLILTIEFPNKLEPATQQQLRGLLPPALNVPTVSADDAEVHAAVDMDPVESFNANKVHMQSGAEAYDEDEDEGSQGMQCRQM